MSAYLKKPNARRLWLAVFIMSLPALAGTAAWAQSKRLEVGAAYQCNGERVLVVRCYLSCEVDYPDRPLRNGFMVQEAEDIPVITAKIQACKQLKAGTPFISPNGNGSGGPGAGPAGTTGTGTTSGGGGLSIISSMIGDVFGFFGTVLLWSVPLALIGWWGYNKYRNSRYFAIRKSNKEAIDAFGTNDPKAREHLIIEAFDSNDHTFRFTGVNRGMKMSFVLLRNIKQFKRRDLEALRFAYLAYNRGLMNEEKFHTYRFSTIYSTTRTDPDTPKYLGLFAFLKKQPTIVQARAAVAAFDATGNGVPNLDQQAIASIQQLVMNNPGDEFWSSMQQRILEGTRWLGKNDIKRSAFAPPAEATPFYVQLGVLDGTSEMLTYSGDGSVLTIAPPGAGKTTCNVIPNLLRWPGPAVVLDVKGEIYDLTSKWRSKNVGPVIKFNPRDPENSAHYNPLSFVRREALYIWGDALGAANMMLVPKEGSGGKNDGYFQDTSVAVLTGVIADLAFWNRPEDRPISRVLSILNRNGWNEFIDRLKKNPEVTAMRDLGAKLSNEHPETLSNILSYAVSGLTAWMGEDIAQVVNRSDWNPLDLRSGKRPTIYICINPQDIEDLASLLRVFVAQHIGALLSQKVPPRGAEPILFVLDEFPRLGGMKPVEKALEVGRGYGLRMWLFAQNFGQIDNAYKNAKGLIENCLVRTYMNPTRESAITIAEDIGQAGVAAGADDQSTVSPQELAGHNYKALQIVIGASSKPAKVRKMPYYENPELNARKGSLEDIAPAASASSAAAAL
jgi:type IV secretion system protein VirD4